MKISHSRVVDMYGTESFFNALEKELPPVFTRDVASKCMGGLLTPKTMSNADALGTGPSVRVRLGKKIAYERTNFMHWLRQRFSA